MTDPTDDRGDCARLAPLLCGFLDDELDAAHALDCERHLAVCPACAAELRRLSGARDRLRGAGLRRTAPEALRRRILADLARETARPAPRPARSRGLLDRLGRLSLPASGLALALSLVLVFAPALDRGVEADLVAGHVRSLIGTHLTDVETSDRHTVKPWFAGKVDVAPPVVDLADRGFPLVGGRLDYVGGRVVAALVYRRHGHVLNLFVWPGETPGTTATTREGYELRRWSRGGLTFWAVSDLDPAELDAFEAAFVEATSR